ncbi:hypothetical protein H8959_016459 [Pygathrix nigripes]
MEAAGFTVSGASHPIHPVMLGDAQLTSRMADDMLKRGIFVIGFSYLWSPRARPGSGYRSQQCTIRKTLTATWRPSWKDSARSPGSQHGLIENSLNLGSEVLHSDISIALTTLAF